MEKILVDNGQKFDFGKTSREYAAYRDIYPKELYERLYSLGVGTKGSRWLDLGTGTGVIPRGLACCGAEIVAADVSENQIAEAKRLSKELANIQYEVCPAEEIDFPENSFDTVTACQCFWYFDPKRIVPKIKQILRPGGLFLKLYMSYLPEDPVAGRSHALVERYNPAWDGGSSAIRDLKIHYFDDPHMENFLVDLPFTRESWHGRIKACRGVLASMDEKTFAEFESSHLRLLSSFPEQFTVRHEVFLTYYYISK